MGLGKTAQSIAVLEFQRQYGGVRGPFLIIAPLTTLGHWQREVETWTSMNCVVYAGSAADRATIQARSCCCPAGCSPAAGGWWFVESGPRPALHLNPRTHDTPSIPQPSLPPAEQKFDLFFHPHPLSLHPLNPRRSSTCSSPRTAAAGAR